MVVLVGAYLTSLDYPKKTYCQILDFMAKYVAGEPLVAQAALITIKQLFYRLLCYTDVLLGGPLYYFMLTIGPFGLVGMIDVLVGSFWWSFDRQAHTLTPASGISTSAVVTACFGLEIAGQMQQV
ncbi:hypothetical protein ID866_2833 [Astraeus odoratus]|nr:hypothetical protein ID866_2833 [Astraeus odoratus]